MELKRWDEALLAAGAVLVRDLDVKGSRSVTEEDEEFLVAGEEVNIRGGNDARALHPRECWGSRRRDTQVDGLVVRVVLLNIGCELLHVVRVELEDVRRDHVGRNAEVDDVGVEEDLSEGLGELLRKEELHLVVRVVGLIHGERLRRDGGGTAVRARREEAAQLHLDHVVREKRRTREAVVDGGDVVGRGQRYVAVELHGAEHLVDVVVEGTRQGIADDRGDGVTDGAGNQTLEEVEDRRSNTTVERHAKAVEVDVHVLDVKNRLLVLERDFHSQGQAEVVRVRRDAAARGDLLEDDFDPRGPVGLAVETHACRRERNAAVAEVNFDVAKVDVVAVPAGDIPVEAQLLEVLVRDADAAELGLDHIHGDVLEEVDARLRDAGLDAGVVAEGEPDGEDTHQQNDRGGC
eukprot:PhM_4_TR11679/c1_g1_i1/m.13317